ncbi:hypothetical protein TNCV_3599231 [Trichonephila clavipes]|nr:hypothetical protein TNCV_3599231 [Trichonephila clavipes]
MATGSYMTPIYSRSQSLATKTPRPEVLTHSPVPSERLIENRPVQKRENAMANAFWVSVRNNISKRWNTTENDASQNQFSADSAIRLPNTSILNSNAADITEYFLDVPNYSILNIL